MLVGEEEREIAQETFAHYYVMNPKNDSFLARQGHQIVLSDFHCYCYGNKSDGQRHVRLFQFQKKSEEGFYVYLQEENESIWVRDLVTLRRDVFGFVDQTSLFRSSFLYDPVEKKLFRLHYLHYFLYFIEEGEDRPVGLVSVEKKKQILKKLQAHCMKLEKSIV